MENKKTYWKGLEQLSNDTEFVKHADKEFPSYLPIKEQRSKSEPADGLSGMSSSRRDFLKMMGFSLAAASLAACEAPVRKAIPYLNKPVEVDPGIPNYYASSFTLNGDYCGIVVKTREGRPIKIEGNRLDPITQGGVNAQVEASILSLYDKERLANPRINQSKADWKEVDEQVKADLEKIAENGGKVAIVSGSIISPSELKSIDLFKEKYENVEHITYDAATASGMLKANEESFGERMIPSMDFSKADVIVSFGADFLGTWISPIEFTKQYSKTRKLGKNKQKMSRHYQFEALMSLTGANADYREAITPSQEGVYVASLYNKIASKVGASTIRLDESVDSEYVNKAAQDLLAARGKSLVVSGSNDPSVQITVNAINSLLGNYGATLNTAVPIYNRKGDDSKMASLVKDAKAGKIAGLIIWNANPVYDFVGGDDLAAAIPNIGLTVAFNAVADETADLVKYNAPDHHYLESWNDANPRKGQYSLSQPTISPLFKTRQAGESMLKWADASYDSYYDFVRENWKDLVFPKQNKVLDYDMFWDSCLHDGVFIDAEETVNSEALAFDYNVSQVSSSLNKNYKASGGDVELITYFKMGVGTGAQANNPWLQEMPDPVTKATWDNYITMSLGQANDWGIQMKEGKTNMADITINGETYTLPVLIQPGQKKGTLGLALGYGREKAGRVADGVGFNAYKLLKLADGQVNGVITSGVSIEKSSKKYTVAQTQTHETFMNRDIVVAEATLSQYQKDNSAGRYKPKVGMTDGAVPAGDLSLWKGHDYNNHHWALVVDMNSCTGCSACTVACQVENNVSVVGRDEVINRREMHWIRIDRYYSSDASPSDQRGLEIASENPEVTFQPMMCQHCNNAPCETVCPVAATTHSSEGLNQMTYNRCIGTRYCANNCPYKVRRFNWFKYHDNKDFARTNVAQNDDLGKMVLNPDVTVRARGVMEKCSMCVQRIQLGKLQAKKEGRRPIDGEIQVACASACPADALTFGDLNDENSKIVKLMRDENEERAYHVLEYLSVKPNVWYLTKVRNKDEKLA
ncbi:MAG: TAT-variant-translocated molybdopterin oxidoreductase [Cyclobacteriaceae bacterium]|nr:TAT-variant-translocated molybdopterin oxidoreductase [Cyclobacteriaceae bacterium]MCH8515178.1 TAT-variant-translocated molybdopterin oxidoreductase [Cyclobacteriaceae bacterium]